MLSQQFPDSRLRMYHQAVLDHCLADNVGLALE